MAMEKEEEEGGVYEAKNRRGIDLATTLERIQKNFVITDPRLPDNPIVTTQPSLLGIECKTYSLVPSKFGKRFGMTAFGNNLEGCQALFCFIVSSIETLSRAFCPDMYLSVWGDGMQIFASDDFLELTEYSREEIIGQNCR